MTVPDSPGAALVAAIRAEMDEFDLIPDAREEHLLAMLRDLEDRRARLQEIVDRDGDLVTSPSGVVKAHPASVEARSISLSITRILSAITTTPSNGKNPSKQRAAARRWELQRSRNGA